MVPISHHWNSDGCPHLRQCESSLQRFGKVLVRKRLRQSRAIAETLRERAEVVACRENERNFAEAQNVRDRENDRPIHIDVEEADVDFSLEGKGKSVIQTRRRSYDLAPEIQNHILDEHRDHGLIFNDQDPLSAIFKHSPSWPDST